MLEEQPVLVSGSFNYKRESTWGSMSNCRNNWKSEMKLFMPRKSANNLMAMKVLNLDWGFLDLGKVAIVILV